MNPSRILHLRPSNFVGGPEQQLLRYAESERNDPFEIFLCSFVGKGEGSDFLRAAERRGVRTISLASRNLGSGSALSELFRALKLQKIDLLCTHGYKADVLGVLASRFAGIPVACFLRGWTGENRKVQIYETADAFALRFADRIVCLSETQAAKIRRRSGLAKKVRIVGNAVEVTALNEEGRTHAREEMIRRFRLPPDCLIVATAGRLSPEKGTSDFVEAAAAVSCRKGSAHFLVFGDGVLRRELERKAHALGLERRLIFAGFHPDLRSLLPAIDLLVNPSHSEEMPNIVLEAMAAGIPVIATAVGGVSDIAGIGGAIHLVSPGDPEILARAIGELLDEPRRAKALAQLGRARVESSYSLAQQISQLHSLYRELLPGRQQESAKAILVSKVSPPLQADHRNEHPLPFLSVVMAVRNEESHIGAVLADLAAQDYPKDRFEILVADGNSADGTAKIVEEFAGQTPLSILLHRNPAIFSSVGRNVGARNARGEYVIFIDGHCQIPNRNLLRDAVELFEKTKADCLCRPQPLTMPGNSPFQEIVAHVRATFLGHGRDSTIYATEWEGSVNPCSSGALYRRTVFGRVGYYDERFDACEDVEFNYRVFKAGLSSYFSPRLAVCYQPRTSLNRLWQQVVRYGRGRCRLALKHPGAFSLSQAIPAGLLVWLVAGGVASLLSRQFTPYYFGGLLAYLVLVLGFSIALGWRYGWRHLLQAPSVYFVIHFGLATGLLNEVFAAILPGHRSKTAVDSIMPLPNSTTTDGLSGAETNRRPGVPNG